MSAVPARERWNERYGQDGFEPFPPTPAPWLVEHESLLRDVADGHEARAIDVACGDNARYLAELGFAVEAVDVSDIAVAALRSAAAQRGLRVDARALDLEHEAPQRDAFDVVVCTNYLQRDLFAGLQAALRAGGLLVYETFSRAHVEELGKSLNPAFVLDHNELLAAFAGLRVRHYREGVVDRGGSPRGVASIVAQRVD
jgi:SAM-dependent methyltransferase